MCRWLLLNSVSCLIALIQTTAFAQYVEPVTIKTTASLSAFKDVAAPNKYYLVPLELAIAKSPEGKERIGIQYYKDEKPPNWKASITISVALTANASEVMAAKNELASGDATATFAFPSLDFRASYFLWNAAGSSNIEIHKLQEGGITAAGTLALTFEIAGSATELRKVFTSSDRQFGIFLETNPKLTAIASRAISLNTGALATKFQELKFLLVSQAQTGNAIMNYIQGEFGSQWGAAEDVAAKKWLIETLGQPTLVKSSRDKWQYGWDLTRADILNRVKAKSSVSLTSSSPLPPLMSTSAILVLPDICSMYATAIVNLEDGAPGCAGLK